MEVVPERALCGRLEDQDGVVLLRALESGDEVGLDLIAVVWQPGRQLGQVCAVERNSLSERGFLVPRAHHHVAVEVRQMEVLCLDLRVALGLHPRGEVVVDPLEDVPQVLRVVRVVTSDARAGVGVEEDLVGDQCLRDRGPADLPCLQQDDGDLDPLLPRGDVLELPLRNVIEHDPLRGPGI